MIEVSVCIANWNCRHLLRECLQSLHRQPQGACLETIVVDNGSTDESADMVAREFPEATLIRNQINVGFSKANNQAAQIARGRYLFFLNNDTRLPPGSLSRLVSYVRNHPDVGIVGPRLRDPSGGIQVSARPLPTLATFIHRYTPLRWTWFLRGGYRRFRRQDFDPNTTRPVGLLLGAALFMTREVFFSCGQWDEDFTFGGEDLELCLRVGRRFPLVYFPEVEIIHHGRASTREHIEFAWSQIARGFLLYFRKSGCGRWPLLAYKIGVTLDAPMQCATKWLQFHWRRALGKRKQATKSLSIARGAGHFLTKGLIPFWKT